MIKTKTRLGFDAAGDWVLEDSERIRAKVAHCGCFSVGFAVVGIYGGSYCSVI